MKQITLTNGVTITLNAQQEEALELLDAWGKSSDLFFLLSGYAGTGKTTIIKEFLGNSGFGKIAVSAPTHKAKKEIARASGYPASTIQSILGLGIDVDIADFDPEDKKFTPVRDPDMAKFGAILIDEGSMLNKDAVNYIIELAEELDVRVIFMGDSAQLPPIGEHESIIFTTDKITYKYQLTKVERQAGDNPIMSIYDSLRDNLNSKNDPFSKVTQFNEETQSGIKFLKHDVFAKEVLTDFTAQHFDPLNAKILCWRNVEVNMWNNAVRKRIIKQSYPDLENPFFLEPGDLLIATAKRGPFQNADELIIKKVTKGFIKAFTGADGRSLEQLECVQVVAYSDSIEKDVTFNVVDYTDQKQVALWSLYYSDFLRAGVTKKYWKQFFAFRDLFLLMDYVDIPGKKPVTPDLDYGYALTVHRSQGSTYDSVFVVETDLNKNRNVRERNQLKYVALSRPRKKAVLLSY